MKILIIHRLKTYQTRCNMLNKNGRFSLAGAVFYYWHPLFYYPDPIRQRALSLGGSDTAREGAPLSTVGGAPVAADGGSVDGGAKSAAAAGAAGSWAGAVDWPAATAEDGSAAGATVEVPAEAAAGITTETAEGTPAAASGA